MTRDTLKKLAALTDKELAVYSVVETAELERNIALANAADARVEALAAGHSKELVALRNVHLGAVESVRAEAESAVLEAGKACAAVASKAAEKVAAADARVNALAAKLAEAERLVDALGGTALGKKMAADKRAAEISENIKRLTAELAAVKA